MITILFFGGWQAPIDFAFVHDWAPTAQSFYGFMWFFAKTIFWFFMFAMVKAIVPRYRYDQLMRLGWKVFLPTSLVAVALVAGWRVFGPAA
jgi:NADH-quinone oxidoreductase subunit H